MPILTTTLLQTGNNVGIQLPEPFLESLGGGKRPPVRVVLNGHEYRTTVGVMGGRYLIPVSAAIRAAAGVAGGEEHDVLVELDTAPREVAMPDDLGAALDAAGLRAAFDALAPSHRKEHVRSVEEAKAPETRARRVAKVVEKLAG
jgi:hypothetical protein